MITRTIIIGVYKDTAIAMTSTVGTTELLQPNYANVEKNGEDDDDRKKYEPSGLVMLLIALAVVFLIAVILIAFAYQRYMRSRADQNVNTTTVKSFPRISNGAVATETQTPPSPVKSPTPKKPARSSLKQDQSRISYNNVLLDVSQGKFVSQSDQFVPSTRDDVSWNLPFIDASREFLDKLDETQPVTKRMTANLSENETTNPNLDQPNASVNIDTKVSQSHSEHDTDVLESEPMLRSDEKDDDIFDDNADCRLPRSPSEQIDLLFRLSLSGEND